jgi:ABC-2 type transport system ATP-binding protein
MSGQERLAKIDELLELVELKEAAHRVTKGYSGGMKRRLELIRGLMSSPEILFLDEPTQGLDPQNRAKMWAYIQSLRDDQGLTLLLTTHYMEEAEVLADKVGIIDHGQLVVEDAPDKLIDEMGADVIRIAGGGNADQYVSRLQQLAYVQGVNAGESLIQVGVDNGNRRLAEVIILASSNSFQIEDISIAKPTLGDVFLKYTGRQLRDR